ncbi:MAG: precorrin-4 C(11)-methyltransferase [Thermoanaerobacteraceae bacterium]|nr:precorrin-4 C(11)-methyltransferase [Thermoanaerobacteraceae bacterium]
MIYFIGAGPGDPELITVKGMKLIQSCGVVIYAGSLVNKEILKYAKKDASIYNSASMALDEIKDIMKEAHNKGIDVARVHTGDPTIYGAIREQMQELDGLEIPYEVIPGVSSFTAAASVLKKELTLPEVSQTIIITRAEGRTPVPQEQTLRSLSKHKATMAIFLSVQDIDKVVEDLKEGYSEDTPVAVVYKATWEDELIFEGTLKNIAEKVKENDINKTAMILIGDFLGDIKEYSKLYDATFSHNYRKA